MSQDDELMTLGQKTQLLRKAKLDKTQQEFNAELIARNNNSNKVVYFLHC